MERQTRLLTYRKCVLAEISSCMLCCSQHHFRVSARLHWCLHSSSELSMQAADFLDDKECLAKASTVVARRAFPIIGALTQEARPAGARPLPSTAAACEVRFATAVMRRFVQRFAHSCSIGFTAKGAHATHAMPSSLPMCVPMRPVVGAL